MFYCSNCGTSLKNKTNFCTNCGSKVRRLPKNIEESPKENHTIAENVISNQSVIKKAPQQKWMLYYILFNIPLYFINTGDDEILGVLIFSTLVFIGFLLYTFQKEKGKPYPIILKIILGLQSLLAVSGIMQRLDYIGSSGYSLIAVISLVLLVFINVKIIFKRNKK